MTLSAKVKTALDEVRILIMGAQILLGFQLRGVFADAFDQLPPRDRSLTAAALGLLVIVIGLLIMPGPYHRLVENGADSGRLHNLVSTVADLALFPFALALGLGVFIVGDRLWGATFGAVAGVGWGGLSLALWYGIPRWLRRTRGHEERRMTALQREERPPTPLHVRIEQMLTEARVILPGAQAIFGFQLSVVLTQAFDGLPEPSRIAHGLSLGFLALSVILLMAPAAYHRLVYAGEDSEEMHRIGSVLVTLATVPLAIGLAVDLYVVITRIAGDSRTGMAAAALALLLLVTLWYGYPLTMRWREGASR